VWGKRMRKKLWPPFRPPSLPEMRAQAERYQAMPKGKYMLLRGWTNLAAVVILGLVLILPTFAQEWWFRAVYLLLFGMQVYMFGRWERSWEEWQRMRLPTVEEAEAIVDELRVPRRRPVRAADHLRGGARGRHVDQGQAGRRRPLIMFAQHAERVGRECGRSGAGGPQWGTSRSTVSPAESPGLITGASCYVQPVRGRRCPAAVPAWAASWATSPRT
jgi:hypothetical protein